VSLLSESGSTGAVRRSLHGTKVMLTRKVVDAIRERGVEPARHAVVFGRSARPATVFSERRSSGIMARARRARRVWVSRAEPRSTPYTRAPS
jgi:hypothetical protein